MTRLNLITFASVFQKQEEKSIRTAHKELFDTLDSVFDVNMYLHSQLDSTKKEEYRDGISVLFIATGGTEGLVVKRYNELPKPMVLLTDGKANSLAASLELSCWVRQQGDECRIIHGNMEHVVQELLALKSTKFTLPDPPKRISNIVNGMRIGVIGQPSDWLVSSGVSYADAYKNWGVEFIDIGLEEVDTYYCTDTESTHEEVKAFKNGASGCVEPNDDDMHKAVRLYHALKQVALDHNLDALTVKCFALIPSTKTTGCLALALLNDEGIVAGCEGDLQSIFTLLLAKKVTGVDGFMANPAFVDVKENTIILAHCTIGLHQTQSYIIRSHFESQSGVAIQGILPVGPVTILKCGGKSLEKYQILTGRIVENQNDDRKCRTQLLIQLDDDSSASYFLENNIGNHHIVLQGNHRNILESVLK